MNKQQRGHGLEAGLPRLLGERLCLDLVNSVEAPLGDHPEDYLGSYADLVRWAHHAGIFDATIAECLTRRGRERDAEAASVFSRAIGLRQALGDVFRTVAHGRIPKQTNLDRVSEEYRRAIAHARLAPAGTRAAWAWPAEATELERPLWAIAESAVDTLTAGDPRRIRECPGAGDCGWLFYDTSRNGSRRWCSMEGCGSRVKMRHHYARHRAERP